MEVEMALGACCPSTPQACEQLGRHDNCVSDANDDIKQSLRELEKDIEHFRHGVGKSSEDLRQNIAADIDPVPAWVDEYFKRTRHNLASKLPRELIAACKTDELAEILATTIVSEIDGALPTAGSIACFCTARAKAAVVDRAKTEMLEFVNDWVSCNGVSASSRDVQRLCI